MNSAEILAEATRQIDDCLGRLDSLMRMDDGWEQFAEEDGVQGCQFISPEGLQFVRAVGIINHPAEAIAAYTFDGKSKKKWDEMLAENRDVIKFNQTFKVVYEKFSMPWPLSDRDFVYAIKSIGRDDGVVCVSKSINGGVPEEDGVVRAELIYAGSYQKRLGPNSTEVTYFACSDMKGMIPEFVTRNASKSRISCIAKIRAALG